MPCLGKYTLPFYTTGMSLKFLKISYGYHRVLKGSVGKNILKLFGQILKILEEIKPLSFIYPGRFVNVKSKCRKEVNHERFTGFKNLAELSPSLFKAQYRPGLRIYHCKV